MLEETGISGEYHRSAENVSSTPHHEWDLNSQC
jgi:hypothetical protein